MASKKRASVSLSRPDEARRSRALPGLSPAGRRGILIATLLLWAACAAFVASAIPRGDAPDEMAHLEYVEHLARTWHFLDFRTQPPATEMHQPPLYYLACALLHAAGAPLFALRLLSTLFGAATMLLAFLLAREWRPRAGFFFHWACAAAVGFLPMNLYLSAAVNNDAMVNALVALGFLVLWRTRASSPSWRGAALVGAITALAMLTKSTALALLAACLAWYARGLRDPATRGEALVRLGAFLGGLLLLWGPWAAHNTLLYGDPLAARAFAEHSSHVGVPVAEFGAPGPDYWIHWVIPWSWRTTWGAYGHLVRAADFMPPAWYAAFVPLVLLSLAGLAARVRPGRWGAETRALAGCLLLGGLVLLASFVRFNLNVFQAQARYFFCYLPLAMLALCAGWDRLGERWGRLAILVFLLLLGLGCLDGVSWRMWHAALPPN